MPGTDLDSLMAMINNDNIISAGPNEAYHPRRGPDFVILQQALTGNIAAQTDYCTAQGNRLGYFPLGFLAAHDRDWKARRIYVV